MQSIVNFVSNDYNPDIVHLYFEYCSVIVKKIFNNEKSKSHAERIYVKTLLEIIRKNVGLKLYYCGLLANCMTHIWDLLNDSNEIM